jgi:hypothetical protein
LNNANLNLADEYKIECKAESIGAGPDKQYQPTIAKGKRKHILNVQVYFVQNLFSCLSHSNFKIHSTNN